MVKQSSPFVKIVYFDRNAVENALKDYVQKLYRENPEIEKVIAFGSFVKDQSVPGSDLDLLIILKKSKLPFIKRISKYMPSEFPIGVDVFAYTQEEVEKMIGEGNFFLRTALEEGKEITE